MKLDYEIKVLSREVPRWVQDAKLTLNSAMPRIDPGKWCNDPFACPFSSYCIPNDCNGVRIYTLDIFPHMHEKQKEVLRAQGYKDALSVPESYLNDRQRWVQQVTKSGNSNIRPGAAKKLDALPYPRHYLDFETVAFAVPRWAGTRPYEKIPFQWSCHTEDDYGALYHESFLATGSTDPRRAFASSLVELFSHCWRQNGPILVYNHGFEIGRISELAMRFKDLAAPLRAIIRRVVDLLPLVREHYYHPDMMGSWGLKAVVPTIAPDLGYDTLEVADGSMAECAYREMVHSETAASRKQAIASTLERYCTLDTLALVRVTGFLKVEN